MRNHGKKYTAARAQVENKPYSLADALPLVQRIKFAKFDETVELTARLGVDPKHADQMVRGTVVLPHGLGRTKSVLVIAGPDKQREAQDAGADCLVTPCPLCHLNLDAQQPAAKVSNWPTNSRKRCASTR